MSIRGVSFEIYSEGNKALSKPELFTRVDSIQNLPLET